MASLQPDVTPLTEEEKQLQEEYRTGFDSNCYLERYTGLDNKFNKFGLISLHHVFSNYLAKGNSLLEVGCGPTIHSVISASRYIKHIVCSDFLESNRATVLKWLKSNLGAHDWSPVFKHVAALENEVDYHKLEECVRQSVKDVIPCDVLQSNPIAPVQKQFDVIVTSCCIECATTDLLSYKKAVGNVANLLTPDGTLIMLGELQGSFYDVGTERFALPVITKQVIHDALSAANLNTIVYWSDEPLLEQSEHDDCASVFMAVAKK